MVIIDFNLTIFISTLTSKTIFHIKDKMVEFTIFVAILVVSSIFSFYFKYYRKSSSLIPLWQLSVANEIDIVAKSCHNFE